MLSNRNGADDIIIVDAATRHTVRVFEAEGRKSRPLWAVDNTLLYSYSTVEAGRSTINRFHIESALTNPIVTHDAIGDWGVSADGEKIIYVVVDRSDELNNRLCTFTIKQHTEHCFDGIPVPFTLTAVSRAA